MKRIASVLIVGLFFASCSQEDEKAQTTDIKPPEGMKVEKNNGLNVPVLEELDTLNPPHMTFMEPEFDFGTVAEGKVVNHEFKFVNTGDSPLIIVDARSSCGCTVPSVSTEPVLPGKTGSIKVRFNSEGKSGNIKKVVTVSANTYPDPFNEVYLVGKIKD